jgi:hypothetical protein
MPVAMVGQVPLIFGRYWADGLVPSSGVPDDEPVDASRPVDASAPEEDGFFEVVPELEPPLDPLAPELAWVVEPPSEPLEAPESRLSESSPPEPGFDGSPLVSGPPVAAQAKKRKPNIVPPRATLKRMTLLKLARSTETIGQSHHLVK